MVEGYYFQRIREKNLQHHPMYPILIFFVDQLQLQEMCEGSPEKIHLLCIIQNFQKLKSMIYCKYLHDLKM